MNKNIDFVFQMNISGMFFQNVPDGDIDFVPKDDNDLRIIIKPIAPNIDQSGYHEGLICKVYKSYLATEEQLSFVSSYNNRRVMLGVANHIVLPFSKVISKDGEIAPGFSPSRDMCPSIIENLLNNVESELSSKAIRILKLIRWRQSCIAPVEMQDSGILYWKVGDGDYPIAPLKSYDNQDIIIKVSKGIHWSNQHSDDLQILWKNKDLAEPLGHTLLREASMLALESPRSSILIMTAALETAVKIHISTIAPDTEWLMETIPSPDMVKILHKYIPLIHLNRGKKLDFWDNVKSSIKKIQELIAIRNKVAHTGKIPKGTRPVKEYIEVVSDFLYLFDVLDGHEWAKTLVSKELRTKLNWPNSKDPTYQVKMKQYKY